MISRILPYVIMILLLAAHFSRANQNILAVIVLLIPLLLFIRQRWVIHTLQIVAYLGAFAWLFSAYQYIQVRMETGDDWIRLLLILGSVALYSLWAGYFLRSPYIETNYGFTNSKN